MMQISGTNPENWKPKETKTPKPVKKVVKKKKIDCIKILKELSMLSDTLNTMRKETPHKYLYDAEMSIRIAQKALENIKN